MSAAGESFEEALRYAALGKAGPVGRPVGSPKWLVNLEERTGPHAPTTKEWPKAEGVIGGNCTCHRNSVIQFHRNSIGNSIGMRTADGKSGFRVEFDDRHGAHINVWSGKQKDTFTFEGNQSMVNEIVKRFTKERP